MYPMDTMKIGVVDYFKYTMLSKPPSRSEAKEKFHYEDGFADGVFKALCELHDVLNRAHLDIRLENMCYDDEGTVVLIDLDRSQRKDLKCNQVQEFLPSNMYQYQDPHWTMDRIDMKQLGLMFCYNYFGPEHRLEQV